MRSTLKGILLGLAVLVLCAGPALAANEGPNWRYVEGGYLNIDDDDLSDAGDNWFLGGAFGGEWWHFIGYFSDGELGSNVDLTTWRVGFGWHGLLGDKADVVGEGYYVDQEIDTGGSSDSDTGWRATGGVRWQPIKLFEADGFANYTDIGSDSDLSYEARGIINIWRLGFGASYEWLDNATQWNAFVRFNFGRR